ncbi:putative bifunctional diguanylate cyclase/phosphodiesterase [Mangrovihabitans endophyticus]|uniref:PAS domain S-box-containing protein/diguanylate cyclase (GGDEF) domain-containing protein n=1 Tax=Mangrovihabitans endophyticus TaxID=1751298 RepID=A0A8J3BXW6_9ACTN|nr:EAL domain-containing protein [Mangrovihabitans endophyticus]GGK80666.1 hypothetical protein GCM10012284_13240 [Mangrovihabitans endophyticus]
MQATEKQDTRYWSRQVRTGSIIAAFLTAVGAFRVAVDWDPALRWMAPPILVAALLQGAAAFLPWPRYLRVQRVRRWLVLWWVGQIPLLFLFAWYDENGLMLYLPTVTLLLVTAAALYPPSVVIGLGVSCLTGYLLLLPDELSNNVFSLLALMGIMVSLVGMSAGSAQRRGWLDAHRRSAERRTELLLEASSDAVFAIGPTFDIRYVSPSAHTLLGMDLRGVASTDLGARLHPDDLPAVRAWMQTLRQAPDGHTARAEARMRRADGSWVYLDVIGTSRMNDPDLRAIVVSLRDIGTRRALEEELSRQAFTDSLTGLPNRALFRDRLEQAVARSAGRPVTVLLIDLDDFKLVNDDLGHSAGDDLLADLAARLSRQMRPGDTLARLGGDEFAVLVEDLDPSAAAVLAERLVAEGKRPMRLGSRDITSTLSIGVATSAGAQDVPAEQLLRNADLAMYAAKRDGRDTYAIFDPSMYRSVLEEAQQRTEMERALEEQQFRVLYQPVVDMASQRVVGAEALVRWQHPVRGLLGPYEFIAGAEASGLIVPLGRWVLREACAQLAQWQRENAGAADLKMNVNLSARQFQYAGLVEDVTAAIADAGIASAALTLEITESMLMQDIDNAIETLHALRRLGVHLAIDDFGTGYSSLSYLKQLPVDVIKIDKSFVDQVETDSGDVALVDAVVGLGQALNMRTVAEGVETDGQWMTLRRIGCDQAQGYLFGRPGEASQVSRMLQAATDTVVPS